MELTLIYTITGFALAGWSVIGNDSVQTLGTFIASKQKWFKWYTLASAASFAMIVTITYGWWAHDVDISYAVKCFFELLIILKTILLLFICYVIT